MKTLVFGLIATIGLVAVAQAGEIQYDLKVSGITCPFCIATSEIALRKVDGVKKVTGDLDAGVISVCADDKVKFTDAQLTRVFRDKGFTYVGMSTRANCTDFDDSNVLTDKQLAKRAARHAAMGHGDEVFDFSADHDHDGDGHPDHPAGKHPQEQN